MESSYSYTLSDLNDVCHFVQPNEKEFGMQNTILRNVDVEVAAPFKSQSRLVNKLFAEDEPRDVVFMQLTAPGKAFETYEKEKNKLAISLKAYCELLNFFASDYALLKSRMDGDIHIMSQGQQWLSMMPSMTFRNPANICFRKTLVKNIHYTLDLYIECRAGVGKKTATLRYSNEDLGILYINPQVLVHLAKDRTIISGLQTYKGGPLAKKSRQS